MREIANLELRAVVAELDSALANARLQKIYELGENEFRLEFHSSAKGTLDLAVELKKRANLTKYVKAAPEQPTQFAMSLRKHLDGAVVESVSQQGMDRVFVISLRLKEKKFKLIFEMFSNGNLILAGDEDKIITCYRGEEWADRKVKRGVAYVFPASAKVSPLEIDEKKLASLVNDKKLISFLAGKIELGSAYLEEAVAMAKLDLQTPASKLNAGEIKVLAEKLREIASLSLLAPVAYLKDGEFVDYAAFPLAKFSELEKKEFATISLLLDEVYSPGSAAEVKERPEVLKLQQERKKLELMFKNQEEAVERLKKEAEELKASGDKIYEKFGDVAALLEKAIELRKKNDWDAIAEIEFNGKKVKINKETGSLFVEL